MLLGLVPDQLGDFNIPTHLCVFPLHSSVTLSINKKQVNRMDVYAILTSFVLSVCERASHSKCSDKTVINDPIAPI